MESLRDNVKVEGKPADEVPGYIRFESGFFTAKELELLNTLPFDITFIDKDDTVKYFSRERKDICKNKGCHR